MKFMVKRGGKIREYSWPSFLLVFARGNACFRRSIICEEINARSSVKDGDPIFVKKKKRGLVNGRYIFIYPDLNL